MRKIALWLAGIGALSKLLRSTGMHTAVLVVSLFAVGALVLPRMALATNWLTGVGSPPTPQLGAEGDLFLDLDSGQIFRKTAGTWVYAGLLRAGALARGPGWLSGAGSPTSGLGDEGDIYLDITTGRAYKKTSGTWLFLADLKGLQGAQGLQGVKGDTGSPGPPGPTPAVSCTWDAQQGQERPITTPYIWVDLCGPQGLAAGRYVSAGRINFLVTAPPTVQINVACKTAIRYASGGEEILDSVVVDLLDGVGTSTVVKTFRKSISLFGNMPLSSPPGSNLLVSCRLEPAALPQGTTLKASSAHFLAVQVAP